MNPEKLELSTEEMRALGYRVIDMVIEHISTLREKPTSRQASRAELEKCLREPLPELGTAVERVLDQLQSDVFHNIGHPDHPRFFAFVPSPSNFVSVMGDALASGFNVFAGNWLEGSGAAQVELVTIDWLRQLCGLPETAGGLFVSGGSVANMTALATARTVKCGDGFSRAVLYCSEQTHVSLLKGLRVLGFASSQVRKIPVDRELRILLTDLREAIQADKAIRLVPMVVVANAGTANTGAVDPMIELSRMAKEYDLWLHVDGSYGVAAIVSEEGRQALRGLELADSISLDPHKWWFQPFEIGCVLVRDARHLRDTFNVFDGIIKDAESAGEEINYYDYGIQLTRGFRALKLWMSIKVFGLAAFREAVERGMAFARMAEDILRQNAVWEIVTPAQLGVITFRYRGTASDTGVVDERNRLIISGMLADGYAMVTSTQLDGRPVLRLCPINPRLTEEDLQETIRRLERAAGDH